MEQFSGQLALGSYAQHRKNKLMHSPDVLISAPVSSAVLSVPISESVLVGLQTACDIRSGALHGERFMGVVTDLWTWSDHERNDAQYCLTRRFVWQCAFLPGSQNKNDTEQRHLSETITRELAPSAYHKSHDQY